jgi:hypothetical protein
MKMARCIEELERIYGIKKGNNQNSLPNNSVSSQEQLASQIGLGVDTLQNYKKLNNLIPELQLLVENEALKATTAYKIWGIRCEHERVFLCDTLYCSIATFGTLYIVFKK